MKAWTLPLLLFLFSCGFTQSTGQGSRGHASSALYKNHSRVLPDNPIVITGEKGLNTPLDFGPLLFSPQFITDNQYLIGPCIHNISACFSVLADDLAEPLEKNNGTWGFDPNDNRGREFFQVNTFWLVKEMTSKFHNYLNQHFSYASSPNSHYQTNYPSNLFSGKRHWRNNDTLLIFSDSGIPNNATYDSANFTISIGEDSQKKTLKFAQDPTVIFHETGHTLVEVMLNFRNDPEKNGRVELGTIFYDESGAINEGICDWFSYFMNHRPHLFEWAFGRYSKASRPMSEDDLMVSPPLRHLPDSRLSYPRYLAYDANFPDEPLEDVHYAGQIWSFFLNALGTELLLWCQMDLEETVYAIFKVLSESLSYMGDMNSKGHDQVPEDEYLINMDPNNSRVWINQVTPLNFRRFPQAFARSFLNIFGNPQAPYCPNGKTFDQDKLEELLDSYGLLNFSTYNTDGNFYKKVDGVALGHSGPNKKVNPINKKRSVLLPKDSIIFEPGGKAPSAYVFDNRQDMIDVLRSLQLSGQIGNMSPQIPPDLPFNNGNGRISPGELIGLAPNLYNDSNYTMGGLQLLANDWDHVKDSRPCNNFDDEWPLISEGGADTTEENKDNPSPGDCHYITRSNGGKEPEIDQVTDEIYPVCFAQDIGRNETTWVNQEEYRRINNISPEDCLQGPNSTKDCFIRVLPGASYSYFSKLAPQSTWSKTYAVKGQQTVFNTSNIIIMETSKWIPPGTTFRCRFRARFTNCEDCWEDLNFQKDDYLDYQYSGGEPFLIIPIEFTVVN